MNNKFAVVVSFIASLLFLVGYSLANTANEGTSTKQNTVDDSAKDSGNFLNQSFMPTPDKIQNGTSLRMPAALLSLEAHPGRATRHSLKSTTEPVVSLTSRKM